MADTSPGYFFVYNNYDLWTVNLRGNKYSIGHKDPQISPKEFFDFTVHEHALEDIPTYYEKILAETGAEKLTYCGHSMGAMVHIISMSAPEVSDYINKSTERAIYYNPAIYLNFSDDPYAKESPFTKEVQDEVLSLADAWNFHGWKFGNNGGDRSWSKFYDHVVKKLGVLDVKKSDILKIDGSIDKCSEIFFRELPFMIFQFMKFFGHEGATVLGGGSGTSVKTEISIYQLCNVGRDVPKFQKRDYGSVKNKEVYGHETEIPFYDETLIDTKIYSMSGSKDMCCNLRAAEAFAMKVNSGKSRKLVEVIPLPGWHHLTPNAPQDTKLFWGELGRVMKE